MLYTVEIRSCLVMCSLTLCFLTTAGFAAASNSIGRVTHTADGSLQVSGTATDDVISVESVESGRRVLVRIGEVEHGPFPRPAKLIVDAAGGDDLIAVDGEVGERVELRGGAGNDHLTAAGVGRGGHRRGSLPQVAEPFLRSASRDGDSASALLAILADEDDEDEDSDQDRGLLEAALRLILGSTGTCLGFEINDLLDIMINGDLTSLVEFLDDLQVTGVPVVYLGGPGNDTMTGSAATDLMIGGSGNDVLIGAGATDILLGGEGSDFVSGGDAQDVLSGGSGNDFVRGGPGTARACGNDARDNIIGGRGEDIAFGNAGADFLNGDLGDDLLFGNEGEDDIFGGSGGDCLFGNQGADRIFGNAGRDRIAGNQEADRIFGNGQRDLIVGNRGDDTIHGGDGTDQIWGNRGRDALHGDADRDRIFGDDGNDEIFGGGGNDVLRGNQDCDLIEGGPGNDSLGGNRGNDTIRGGPGKDRLRGGEDEDLLDGGPDRDRLRGGPGDDELFGREGRDSLNGGLGDDLLDGGEGNDQLRGRPGRDVLRGGPGRDRMRGQAGDDHLDGGPNRDRMWGGIGQDQLVGGAGNDRMRGGNADDVLDGGPGHDRMWGNAGDDCLEGGDGNDRMWGRGGDDCLTGGPGDDRLRGNRGDDRLFGDAGDDRLRGGPGEDLLDGGAGDDDLGGGGGSDRLFGGPGDDRLRGKRDERDADGTSGQSCDCPFPELGEVGCLRGVKFDDQDADGERDDGEPLLPGWTIELDGPCGSRLSTVTDAEGAYEFCGRRPGVYQISEVLQPGWTPTLPEGGQTSEVLDAHESIENIDFGNVLISDLALSKGLLGELLYFNVSRFEIRVSNVGEAPISGPFTVTDVLPVTADVEMNPLDAYGKDWSCNIAGQTVTCTYLGSPLEPGESAPPITIETEPIPLDRFDAEIENCARVEIDDADLTNNQDCLRETVSFAASRADLRLVKRCSLSPIDDSVTCLVTVTNLSPPDENPAQPITIKDTLPVGISFVGTPAGSPWECVGNGDSPEVVLCTYTGPPLPSGEAAPVLHLDLVRPQPGETENCATVETPADANPDNNEGCVTLP